MSDGEVVLAARDEVRVSAFGILRCPSCGELAAELLGNGHLLIWWVEGEPGPEGRMVAEGRDGQRVELKDYDSAVAAANIALADEVWFRETLALREIGFPV